jgi:PAS domain S-box-containing protein
MQSPEVSGSIKEIKELRRRVAKLEQVNRRLATSKNIGSKLDKAGIHWERTFDTIKDSIMVLDNEFKVIQANLATSRFFGKPLEEIIGLNCWKIVHGTNGPCRECPLKVAQNTRNHEEAELYLFKQDTWINVSVEPILDDQGDIHRVIHVIRDITERKKDQDMLVENEERFRSIFDNANDVIVFVTKFGKILKVNAKIKQVLGYDPDELIGKNFMTFGILSAKNAVTIVKLFKEAVNADGFPHKQDLDITDVWLNHKDGHTILLEASTTAIRKDEKLEGFLSILRNVTESRKAQEAYRSLVDHSLQGLAIFQEGRIVFANQAMAQITGYSVDEMLASPPEKVQVFVHPEDQKLVWSRHKKRLRGKLPPEHYELRGIRKDGSVRWLEINASLVEYQGRPAIQAAYLDITEQKNAEQRKQEYIRELQFLSESAVEFVKLTPDGDIYTLVAEKIHELDKSSIVAVNTYDEASDSVRVRALVGLGKYTRAVSQIMGSNPVGRCFPLDDAAREGLGQGKLLKIPGGIYDISPGIPKVICQAIEKLLGLGDVYAMGLNSEGRLYGSATIFTRSNKGIKNQELIETFMNQAAVAIRRWKADTALRRSEAKWRALTENSSDYIMLLDRDGTVLFINRTTQLSPQEVIGRPVYEFVPPEYKSAAKKCIEEVFQTGQSREFETEYHPLTGDIQTFEARLGPVLEGDKVVAVTVGARDITKRKKAEEALKESEQRFKTLFECAPDGIYLNDMNGIFVDGNKAAEEITGYKREELIGSNFAEPGLLSPEEIPKALAGLEKNRNYKSTGPEEFTLIHKDGSHVPVEIRTFPVRIGDEILALGIARDISERKKAEKMLRDSEEQFRVTFAKAGIGMAIVGADGRIVDSNAMLQDMLGCSKQELTGMMFTEFTHPDDAQKDLELFQELFTGKRDRYQMEKCYIRKDGQLLWGRLTASLVRDTGGEPRFGIDMLEDITQHRKTVKALEQSEEKYRNLFEHARDAIVTFDLKGNITDANEAIKEYGFKQEQLIGKSLFDYVIEGHKARAVEDFETLIGGHSVRGEMDVITPKGTFTVEYSDNPIMHDRDVVGIQAILTDITERKRAGSALLESEQKYRELFENAREAIVIIDMDKRITDANKFVEEYGFRKGDLIGRNHLDFVVEKYKEKAIEDFEKLRHGTPQEGEFEVITPKGNVIVYYRDNPIVRAGIVIGVQAALMDITERKRAEEELRKYQVKLKAMAYERLTAEECERQRIAMGLHDEICQKLVFIKLALESSLRLISDSNVLSQLRILSASIGETIDKVSFLIFELSNPVLQELGFVTAMKKHLAEEIQQKHGIEFKLEADEQLNIPHEEIKNSLFCISKELLTNIVKHAQARNVKVSVHKRQNQIHIVIQDDGVGFDTAKVYSDTLGLSRFGLFSIREQLENLGGHFAIESEPGRGTTATIVVPLEKITAPIQRESE